MLYSFDFTGFEIIIYLSIYNKPLLQEFKESGKNDVFAWMFFKIFPTKFNFDSDQLKTNVPETRDKFISIIDKLESKAFSEKALQLTFDNIKSTKKKITTLNHSITEFPIRILLPTSELVKKLRTIGIIHKTITKPKSKDNLTTLKDYLIIR
jgi:hypothetical protein